LFTFFKACWSIERALQEWAFLKRPFNEAGLRVKLAKLIFVVKKIA
jgi:hypothetical protein